MHGKLTNRIRTKNLEPNLLFLRAGSPYCTEVQVKRKRVSPLQLPNNRRPVKHELAVAVKMRLIPDVTPPPPLKSHRTESRTTHIINPYLCLP